MQTDKDIYKDVSIDYLDLDPRTLNALKRNRVETIYDLYQLTADEIKLLRGIGIACVTKLANLTEDDLEKAYRAYQATHPECLLSEIGSPEVFKNITVDHLDLDARTVNALNRNDINSVYDLITIAPQDFHKMRGIGASCLEQLKAIDRAALQRAYDAHQLKPVFDNKSLTISEYMKDSPSQNYDLFVAYYNGYPEANYDTIIPADREISKTRAHQIVSKILTKITSAVKGGLIKNDFLHLAGIYAENITRLDHADMDCDDRLNSIALSVIASKIIPEKITILYDHRLEHRWLIPTAEKERIEETLYSITDLLDNATAEYSLQDLATEFGISLNMILDIKSIVNRDGFISRKNNHAARGDTVIDIVSAYLESLDRPATVTEIANTLKLNDVTVRAAISRMSDARNVGQSMYTLRDRHFENLSVTDLVKGYLIAAGRPILIDRLVKYVQSYRDIDSSTLYTIILDPDSSFEYLNDYCYHYVGLKGAEYDLTRNKRYEIRLDLAIVEAFRDIDSPISREDLASLLLQKYGDKVSHNVNSFNANLSKLLGAEVLRKVGNELLSKRRGFDEDYDKIYRSLLAS